MDSMKFQTLCVHSGSYRDEKTRGTTSPIFPSTAYEYLGSEARPYPRYFNTPNQEIVVRKLCALEQGEDGVVFSSGMAAISTALLALLKAGEHAVIQDDIYGGTRAFVTGRFPALGLRYTLVDRDAAAIEAAILPETRLVYVESPTNPTLNIVDLRQVAKLARSRGLLSLIDNTFASPVNQNPLTLGIDVSIHSGTKYLGGHGDLTSGAVITSRELADKIRATATNLGGNLNAQSCHLLERSLKTLCLRVERQTENAGRIAEFLQRQPGVKRVHYPGLKSHPGHDLARAQMKGFGAMLSFEVDPQVMASDQFMRALRLIRPAMSLGGVESTICDPATTSHRHVPVEVRERLGISAGLLRLSVGVEHSDDLIADLRQALGRR
jgi:cystathionine beta-lyase/cystathionine gamma-synthase